MLSKKALKCMYVFKVGVSLFITPILKGIMSVVSLGFTFSDWYKGKAFIYYKKAIEKGNKDAIHCLHYYKSIDNKNLKL